MNKTMSVFLEVDKLVKVTSSSRPSKNWICRSSVCKRIRYSNATNRGIWWYYRRYSSGYCYNKYFNIELPSYLGFFAGKRFVPIATATFSLIVGIIMCFVWPYIQGGLNTFSHQMIDANRTIAKIYIRFNRTFINSIWITSHFLFTVTVRIRSVYKCDWRINPW